VLPEQVCAGIANLKAIAFSGLREDRHWVHIEIFEGSYGGRHGRDGMDSVDTLYANTRNNPVEDIETHVPLRVNRYELRADACAAGKWRGGIGSVKEIEFLAPGMAGSEGDGHAHPAWGFAGGARGVPSRTVLRHAEGREEDLPSMMAAHPAAAGDAFIAIGGSGGGYGDPREREPGRVLEDYLDGYIGRDQAERDYGVVITASATLDEAATRRLRAG